MDEEKRKARLDLLKNNIKNENQFIFWQMSYVIMPEPPLSPVFKYEEISELINALENKDKNYYFEGNTLCRKKNTNNKEDEVLSEAQKINDYIQKGRNALTDPLHEAIAKQNFGIPEPIEVQSIKEIKNPKIKNCKLCNRNFEKKNISTYQVITIDEYYSLKKNTHYLCKNCLNGYMIEEK